MDLTSLALDTLTPGMLIIVIVVMILRGDLVPRPLHKMMLAAKDEIIAEQAEHIEEQEHQIAQLVHGQTHGQ